MKRLIDYFKRFTIAPLKFTFQEKCIASIACLAAIAVTGSISHVYAGEHVSILVASMGASAVILFAVSSSPMASPWSFVGGQMFSALIGVLCAFYIDDIVLAAALAVGLSVLLMLNLGCLHPPGAATALAPVLGNFHPTALDVGFLWMPVGINVLVMLFVALIVNRVLKRDYPAQTATLKRVDLDARQGRLVGVSREDVEQATQHIDHYLDISADELCQIFTRLQLNTFIKNQGELSCGEIMVRDIITVEFGTEVESAWQLMHEHHLKVLPVLDKSRHIIGIVTRYDFFKNVELTPYASFQDKLHAFIKRTPDVSANKPEAVGQIMTRQVKTLPLNAQAAEAIPLIVNEGHHHVPIVDDQGHFVGMLFQSRLLAVMFSQGAFVQQF